MFHFSSSAVVPCEGLALADLVAEEKERACIEYLDQAQHIAEHLLEPKNELTTCSMTEKSTGAAIVSGKRECVQGGRGVSCHSHLRKQNSIDGCPKNAT